MSTGSASTHVPPSVAWADDAVRIIDQRELPAALVVRDLRSVDAVVDAIATLAVRGANVIGTTGALGVALAARQGLDVEAESARIAAARPTAVNLAVAVGTVLAAWRRGGDPLAAATDLLAADREQCRLVGEAGREELADATTLLTHCNTGRLATTGWGTALGVVYAKQAAGEPVRVFATETRPLRQGARLTAWELERAGVEVTQLVDSAAAALLASGQVDAVVVGADRIAVNGDTANKVGTRALAVAAHHEGVPFYVAATLNAVDAGLADGAGIPIEFRSADEVAENGGRAWNPGFDVTPGTLVTGIITERGVLHPPYADSIARVLAAGATTVEEQP